MVLFEVHVLLRMASACTGPTLEIGEFSEETEGEITEKEAWGRLFPVGRGFMAFGEYDIYIVCCCLRSWQSRVWLLFFNFYCLN